MVYNHRLGVVYEAAPTSDKADVSSNLGVAAELCPDFPRVLALQHELLGLGPARDGRATLRIRRHLKPQLPIGEAIFSRDTSAVATTTTTKHTFRCC